MGILGKLIRGILKSLFKSSATGSVVTRKAEQMMAEAAESKSIREAVKLSKKVNDIKEKLYYMNPINRIKSKIKKEVINNIEDQFVSEDLRKAFRQNKDIDIDIERGIVEFKDKNVDDYLKIRDIYNNGTSIKTDLSKGILKGRSKELLNRLRDRALQGENEYTRRDMYESYKVIEDMINRAVNKYGDDAVFDALANWNTDFYDELERLVAAIYDEYYNTQWPDTGDKGDLQGALGRERYQNAIDELAITLGVKTTTTIFGGNSTNPVNAQYYEE